MPAQGEDQIKTYRGDFDHVRLAFTPDSPLALWERSSRSPNYHTTLANLHLYLDGEDAMQGVPSGYILWILGSLLDGLRDLVTGKVAKADWVSDPWQFSIRGDPSRNRAYISLQVPGRWVAMDNVGVPLDEFGRQVIRVSQRWVKYLDRIYHEEIAHPEWGEQYRLFDGYLSAAQKVVRAYEDR
jgi:hypothetical protein